VIFLDLNMPGISGYDVAVKLRATPWGRAIRLVALTGMGQKGDVDATRAAGFDAHLTKPARIQEVIRLATAQNDNVLNFPGVGHAEGGEGAKPT
jgi:CheY-like chemotaxis protein